MKILLLAGGGGHTTYAYALAQALHELHERAELYCLVPQGDHLSAQRLAKYSIVKELKKPRGPKTPHHEFIAGLITSGLKSLREVKGDVVVSTGSNFCIPPAISALLKGIPVINIESSIRFTRASKTARILSNFARITALQWEEQQKILKGRVYGPLIPRPEVEVSDQGYILVTGGTFGHKQLFDAVSEIGWSNVLLQTGQVDKSAYEKAHPEWKVIDTTSKFAELIAGASMVITHFGATAIEAATIYRKPTVMVLNKEWTRTVGKEDAAILASKLGVQLITDVNPDTIREAVRKAACNSRKAVKPGTELLARDILEVAAS
jgi:UDP-N-acetylglucosamine--N-acetylmuramyl-(pentapeptide) pyrophosphoryl-undecaprenol N-acetylglucosamine transferase